MNLTPVLKQRFFDSNGLPLAGGLLYTYQAGTTTPQATYTDSTGGTPNPNPIVLSASGECSLWVDQTLSYKFVLQDALGVQQWDTDGVLGLASAGAIGTPSLQDGAVTTAKLADNSVTAAKLSSDASVDFNRAVTTNHLRDGAVTTAKITDANVTTAKLADGSVTNSKLQTKAIGSTVAAGGVAVSSGTGYVIVNWNSPSDVTNLSVTLTTVGRPVSIRLQSDNTVSGSGYGPGIIGTWSGTSGASASQINVSVLRDGSNVYQTTIYVGTNTTADKSAVPASAINFIDTGAAAGTHTYTVQAWMPVSGYIGEFNTVQLVAYEI